MHVPTISKDPRFVLHQPAATRNLTTSACMQLHIPNMANSTAATLAWPEEHSAGLSNASRQHTPLTCPVQ